MFHLLQMNYSTQGLSQGLSSGFSQQMDPTMIYAILGIVGVVVAVALIAKAVKDNTGGGSGGGARKAGPAHFSAWTLKRTAASYGLNAVQIALLDRVFRKAQVTDPKTTLGNPEAMDRHFKKAYRDIESNAETEAESENQKSVLFSIRAAVDAVNSSQTRVLSTRRLPDGMAAVLTGTKGENYPVKVLSAKGEQLLVEAPRSSVGTPVKFSRGTKLTLSFYTKSSQGYRFDTRAQGSEATPSGPALALSHSDRVSSLPNRRHKRKETRISCYFSLVQIIQREQGKKMVKETIVDGRRTMGTLVDVSAGGCAVKTAAPLKTGEYAKVEFDDARGVPLAAFGRVVRTNKTGVGGGVMHMQFLKATRKTMNSIQATVYGYEQE